MGADTEKYGERLSRIIDSYRDSAKLYIQLSSAGLVLPIVLAKEILGPLGQTNQLWHGASAVFIVTSWIAFFLSIPAGAVYQYASVKFVEFELDESTPVPPVLKRIVTVWGPGSV